MATQEEGIYFFPYSNLKDEYLHAVNTKNCSHPHLQDKFGMEKVFVFFQNKRLQSRASVHCRSTSGLSLQTLFPLYRRDRDARLRYQFQLRRSECALLHTLYIQEQFLFHENSGKK